MPQDVGQYIYRQLKNNEKNTDREQILSEILKLYIQIWIV